MIVCFGEALVDLYARPLGASIEAADDFVPKPGGAPSNVAIALGRLGIASRFVGAVGRDGHGDRLLAALRDAGVDVRAAQRRSERTGVAFVRVATTGERSFLFYRRGGADLSLDLAELQGSSPLAGARWIVLGSSAFVTDALGNAARWMLAQAAALGVRVAVDLNVRAHLWADEAAMRRAATALVAEADVVKASDDDLRALGLDATLDALAALARADAVLALTRGADGWEAAKGAIRARGAPLPAEVVDATGAGDAFTAGMLLGVEAAGEALDDGALRSTMDAAAALGAMAVTRVGATEALRPPWPDAVRRLLREEPSR